MSSRHSTPAQTSRFIGDGLDFRRPTTAPSQQTQDQTTIDLTLDDDGDDEEEEDDVALFEDYLTNPRLPSLAPSDTLPSDISSRASRAHSRAPLNAPQRLAVTEIIDITSDENERDGDSSDIEIVDERPVFDRPRLPGPREMMPHFTSPPPELRRANAQSFAPGPPRLLDLLGTRRDLQASFALGTGLFENVRNYVPTMLRAGPGAGAGPVPEPLNVNLYDPFGGADEYDDLQMDYAAPAFVIEDPGVEVEIVPVDNYKPPTAPRKGFTRDLEEEGDVLVCVGCDEELATGDVDDVQHQVWVSKKCGHVYCGSCISRRGGQRTGTDRNGKKTKQRKIDDLKECKVDGCSQKLTGKNAMFQIYL